MRICCFYRFMRLLLVCLLFNAFFLSGCALVDLQPVPPGGDLVRSEHFPDYLVVTSQAGDSVTSLAEKYLKDASMGWLIAEFNELKELVPGEEIIIPLEPYLLGGLSIDGYQEVPILTYHNFSTRATNKMTVTASEFEAQMRYLKDHDYHVISMKSFFEFLDFKRQIPKKSVLIAIDDGWRSFYTLAYPILKKYGYPATLFIYTGLIDGEKNHLNWAEIKEMSKHQIEMQCHTRSHRYLTKRKSGESYLMYVNEIENELNHSASIIEAKINKKVDLLAYPYGETNHLVSAYTFKNGFRGAFTVNPKPNPFFVPRYRINRIMIFGGYDINKFKASLKTFKKLTLQ